jgi:hypothetical protein
MRPWFLCLTHATTAAVPREACPRSRTRDVGPRDDPAGTSRCEADKTWRKAVEYNGILALIWEINIGEYWIDIDNEDSSGILIWEINMGYSYNIHGI